MVFVIQSPILEECQIYPPHSPSLSLPLTFLDIPWLQYPPLQPLFFFQLPLHHNIYNYFISTILPSLKESLSSALQYFFPFAGKLTPNHNHNHNLVLSTSNHSSHSIGLTVAVTDTDFDHLCSFSDSKSAHLFHQLAPSLPTTSSSSSSTVILNSSLLAIQITFFPSPSSSSSSPGFCIGFSSHPVVCDQRTFSNFLHCWASFSKFGHASYPAPTFDRSVIFDSHGLQPTLFNQWLGLQPIKMNPPSNGLVRSTFVMGPKDIENAKQKIQAHCDNCNRQYPVLLSPYVVTCSFIWACFLKAQAQNNFATRTKGPMYFGFIAGGITRLPFQVPVDYYGNCVGFGRAVAQREELLKENFGILAAADAIGLTVKKLDSDLLGGAKNWISEWETLIGSEDHIHVVGSPKVGLYGTDFGWGRPTKIEEISIDWTKAVSLTESRDMKGGIEIGLSQPNNIMDAFSKLFNQGRS
ncbi:Anthocyanin 5-aromatic acyltransferase [Bienertia sinuspersici]